MAESSPAAQVIAVVSDLIFGSKIRATAQAVGSTVRLVRSVDELEAAIRVGPTRLILLDLNALGDQLERAIAVGRAAIPKPRVVGYVSHVDQALADRAVRVGADEVLPRSKFVQVLPDLLAVLPGG